MPARKGSQGSGTEPHIPAAGEAARKAGQRPQREPSAGSHVDDQLAGTQDVGPQRKGVVGWSRSWLRRYGAEFNVAQPETQVAQVYHITAILAVLASVLAGLWAFGEHFWEPTPAPPLAVTSEAAVSAMAVSAPLSLVVLPFVNLSGDAAQEYFADGITDSLTTDLSRALPGSFVVARATAFAYKGKAIDARQIGRELRVRYVLEGSALLDRDNVRVNAQLVDAQLGNEIWAERFDTARSDMLRVQDEIVGRLSRAIALQLIAFEARRSEREQPGGGQAIDLVVRAQAVLNRPSSAVTLLAARDLFEQALKLQPDNADALAGVGASYVFEVLNGYYETGNDARLRQAEPLIARALALDSRHLGALKARAALLRAQGKFDDAIAAAKAVIAQNPGEPWAYKEVALSSMYLGRAADALEWFEKAERFGPNDPSRWTWLAGKGQVLILLGRDDQAIAALRAAIDSNSADLGDYAVLAAAYALAGRSGEARTAMAQYRQFRPATTVDSFRNLSPVPLQLTDASYRRQRERLKDGLRKAGMPD
jgi:TolB-like protein/Flp pilus assembly protein TadD